MRRTGPTWIVGFFAVAIVVGGCSKSERTAPPSAEHAVGTGGAGANLSDDEFVRDVALKNMAEVELSRMALDRATSPNIKAFAQMMIDDHGAAGDKLKTAVSGRSIEWPAQLDDKHKKTGNDLAEKRGAEFDREYVKAMIEGHQDFTAKLESRLDVQSLADWKTAAAGRTDSKALPEPKSAMGDVQVRPHSSDNAETMKINRWAAEIYPVAQKHLDTARALETVAKRSTD